MREGETPVPIPNTTVKTFTADGTMRATAWESRWLPDFFINMIFISDEKLLLKVTASDDWWKSVRASSLDVIRTLKTEYRQANIDWRVMKNRKTRKHNESEENPSNDRGTRKCSTSQKRHKNRRSIEFAYNAMYVKENSKPELQSWFIAWTISNPLRGFLNWMQIQ